MLKNQLVISRPEINVRELKDGYCFQDTETTGLNCWKHALLEYCGVITNFQFEEIRRVHFYLKFDPSRHEVSPESTKTNNILLEEHNARAIDVFEATDLLIRFFDIKTPEGGQRHIPYENWLKPAGQNPKFDMDFIKEQLQMVPWPLTHQHYDTATLGEYAKRHGVVPREQKLSLGNLAEYFGISNDLAHTAEGDVDMTLSIARTFDTMLLAQGC